MSRYEAERFETIVIGGGQAGWRWATTSPAGGCRSSSSTPTSASAMRGGPAGIRCACSRRPAYDGLPGMRFPAPRTSFPTKDEMADYLEAYAQRFELPVRTGVTGRRPRPIAATASSWQPATCGSRPTTSWWRCPPTSSRGSRHSPPSSTRTSVSSIPTTTGDPPSCRTATSSSSVRATRAPTSRWRSCRSTRPCSPDATSATSRSRSTDSPPAPVYRVVRFGFHRVMKADTKRWAAR